MEELCLSYQVLCELYAGTINEINLTDVIPMEKIAIQCTQKIYVCAVVVDSHVLFHSMTHYTRRQGKFTNAVRFQKKQTFISMAFAIRRLVFSTIKQIMYGFVATATLVKNFRIKSVQCHPYIFKSQCASSIHKYFSWKDSVLF